MNLNFVAIRLDFLVQSPIDKSKIDLGKKLIKKCFKIKIIKILPFHFVKQSIDHISIRFSIDVQSI